MEADGPCYVICAATADLRTAYPGSVTRRCGRCRATVWVSPGMVAAVDGRAALPVCERCGAELVQSKDCLAPEVPEHVREDLRRVGMSDELIEALRSALTWSLATGRWPR